MAEVTLIKSKPTEQVVTKNVSAIHIGARLSLTQRKLINALLYHAYDTLLIEDTHTIPVPILMEMIGFESRNQTHLKKAIRGLTETSIEWDMMADDGSSVWEVATLLSYARIQKGQCTYRYDKSLAEKLHDPSVFAKINLSVVRDIRSAHTLALYENCYRYIGIGHTPRWDIDVFRKLMAVDGLTSYQQFKILKRDIITPAMKEINKLSNITVELVTEKKGRAIVSLQFKVTRNPQMSLIGIESEDDISSHKSYKALIEMGIQKPLARLWTMEYDEVYIAEKIDLANEWDASGKIKSTKAGFLKAAIESDYHSETAEKKKKRAAVENAKKTRREFDAQIEMLGAELREVERSYRHECVRMMNEAWGAVSEADQKVLQSEFETELHHRVFIDAFRQGGWGDRRIYERACAFWASQSLIFPDIDDWAQKQSLRTPQSLRADMQELQRRFD